jgi:hypothetical protein
LDAVGTKGLHVGIVDEADSPEVDDAEVGRGLLQGPDVQHLVHLALLFSLQSSKLPISRVRLTSFELGFTRKCLFSFSRKCTISYILTKFRSHENRKIFVKIAKSKHTIFANTFAKKHMNLSVSA